MITQTFHAIKQSPNQFQRRSAIQAKCYSKSYQSGDKCQLEQNTINKQVNGLIITGVTLGLVSTCVGFPNVAYAYEDQNLSPYEKRLREKERRMELLKGVREKAVEKAAAEQQAPQEEGLKVNPFQSLKSMVEDAPAPSALVVPAPSEPNPSPAEIPNPFQGFKMPQVGAPKIPEIQAPSNPFQDFKMPEVGAPKIPEIQAPSNPIQGLKSMIPEAPTPPPPAPSPAPPVDDTFKSFNFQEMMQTPPKQQEKKEVVQPKQSAKIEAKQTTMKVPQKLDIKKIEQEQQKNSGKRKGPLPLFVAQLVLLVGYVGLGLLFTKYEKTTSKALSFAGEKVSEVYGVLEEKISKTQS